MRLHRRSFALFALLAALECGLAAPATARPADDQLKVVCTIPDLVDITERIGGDRVEVKSICRGLENLHFVSVRPSHLVAVTRADVFVQVGLSLEVGFVPGLLRAARNTRVMPPDGAGFINVSTGWEAIQVPQEVNRSAGDVHPEGNPHMNLHPEAGRFMAQRILEGLVRADPAFKADYERRHAEYLVELEEAEKRWAEMGARWAGKKIIEYHQEFDYLIAHYGMTRLAMLEAKPGIPPTPKHLAQVIAKAREQSADALVVAHWSNNKNAARVSSETGVPLVEVPNMCNPKGGTGSWIGMMDQLHERLDAALSAP